MTTNDERGEKIEDKKNNSKAETHHDKPQYSFTIRKIQVNLKKCDSNDVYDLNKVFV